MPAHSLCRPLHQHPLPVGGSWSKQRASAWSCTTRCPSCLLLTPDSRRKHPATMSRERTTNPTTCSTPGRRRSWRRRSISSSAPVPARAQQYLAHSRARPRVRLHRRASDHQPGRVVGVLAGDGRRRRPVRRAGSVLYGDPSSTRRRAWRPRPGPITRGPRPRRRQPLRRPIGGRALERRPGGGRGRTAPANARLGRRDSQHRPRCRGGIPQAPARGGRWFFLASRMLPGHKEQIIRQIHKSLKNKSKPTGVVCTQVLEAGVDLSFRAILRGATDLPISHSVGWPWQSPRRGRSRRGPRFSLRSR